jgi:hypothetical protein
MTTPRAKLAVAAIALAFAAIASGQTVPPGWTKESDDKAGTITLKPSDLKRGDLLLVRYYKREQLNDQAIEDWLGAQLRARGAPSGKWANDGEVKKNTANFATASRTFREPGGREGALLLTAMSLDGQTVRMVAIVMNSSEAFNRHKDAAMKAVAELAQIEKDAAVAEDRGLKVEPAPPQVKGITAGGAIKPGRYRGNMITSTDNSVLRAVEIAVFDNGEYEFIQGQARFRDGVGTFSYSPGTGRFNAEDPLINSRYDPDEDFCIYGVEADGTAVIYAEDYYGLGVHKTRLRFIGPPDRDPPTLVAKRKAEAEAEAARYKYVTEPGKGIKPDDLEVVLITQDLQMNGGGSTINYGAYILMKDGRVRDGLPVAPQDLDLAMSRSREPDSWGYWRRKDGLYEFSWPTRPNEYSAPVGTQIPGLPVPAGTKLEGTFKGASSWGMVGGMGGANFWGVNFSPKGRFEKWKHGIAGSGTPAFEGQVSVGTTYDDKGSATVFSGNNVGGGTVSKKDNPDAHRMGWYEFDGYALTLRFDNGKIERIPTLMSDDKKSLWFEGYLLSKDDDKKK